MLEGKLGGSLTVSPATVETWVPFIAVTLTLASLGLHHVKKTQKMTAAEMFSNMGIFVVWRYLFFAGGLALQIAIFSAIAAWVPWKIPASGASFVLAVLVMDFCYYLKHRGEHRIGFLWAQHAVHHSSEEFNFSTSLRLPWVGSYLNWPFFLPALALGFSAPQVLMGHQVVLAYQYLIHTELVGRLGFLETFLNTPSHHRVHHGRNPEYLDKNYGGILIVWDRLFGSFIPETTPVDYGTVHRMTSRNPIRINFQPWLDLWNLCRQEPTWGRRIRRFWLAPGDAPGVSHDA